MIKSERTLQQIHAVLESYNKVGLKFTVRCAKTYLTKT